jgi:putative membrane protein
VGLSRIIEAARRIVEREEPTAVASLATDDQNIPMSSIVEPLVHVLISGLSVFIVAKLLPGISVKSFTSAVFFALVVGVFNAIAWHYLALLTIPFTIVTLGLGYLIVNGLLFLLAARVVKGVEISGCITAALASVGVSLVNGGLHLLFGR